MYIALDLSNGACRKMRVVSLWWVGVYVSVGNSRYNCSSKDTNELGWPYGVGTMHVHNATSTRDVWADNGAKINVYLWLAMEGIKIKSRFFNSRYNYLSGFPRVTHSSVAISKASVALECTEWCIEQALPLYPLLAKTEMFWHNFFFLVKRKKIWKRL